MSDLSKSVLKGLEEALVHAKGGAVVGLRQTRVVVADLNVRAIRQKSGLSQPLFAQAMGISVGTLRNWEQGIRRPQGPARSLLTVFDRDPRGVISALHGELGQ
jgi:putative transcriptional regulator